MTTNDNYLLNISRGGKKSVISSHNNDSFETISIINQKKKIKTGYSLVKFLDKIAPKIFDSV